MVNLYKARRQSDNLSYKTLVSRKWHNIEQLIKIDHDKYLKWMHETSAIVPSDNLLVRLIEKMFASPSVPLFNYIDRVEENMMGIERHFHIVNFDEAGKTHTNVLNDSEVVLVAVDGQSRSANNWRELVPIRFVRTDSINTGFINFNEEQLSGTSYLEIDLMMLMLMYRGWYLDRINMNASTDISNFVYGYAIGNAFKSYFNLVLINIYLEDMVDSSKQSSIPNIGLKNHGKNIHKFYSVERAFNIKQKEIYSKHIRRIPCFEESALETLRLSYSSSGINNLLFEVVCRVSLTSRIISIFNSDLSHGDNIDTHNDIWFALKRLKSSNKLSGSKIKTDDSEFLVKILFDLLKDK